MKTCAHCGHANDPSASFCIQCSKPLGQGNSESSFAGLATVAFQQTAPRREAPFDPSMLLQQGTVFAGRYEIVEEIGRGGMGVVYRATEQLGSRTRDIALKLIRADRTVDQKAVEGLLYEGALIQEIGHPNVVKVYNVGESDGHPFVAMKFVEGISLREWHRRRMTAKSDVPLDVAAAIIFSILDGLGSAHALGVVHRDLKPENIILTSEPEESTAALQILDFGIARAGDSTDAATGTGLGTAAYMAPEQQTYPESVGPSADLYSLSRIFYELLMDVLPKGHWQPPSGGRPDVPLAIDAVIERGLNSRPASRQENVDEYRAELKKALSGETSKRHRAGTVEKEKAQPDPSGRKTVKKGAVFVLPQQDESGNWHMPDMVDEGGKRTGWSWWGGYMGAYPKWVQWAMWGFIALAAIAIFGG